MRDIAEAAGVSAQTVYDSIGSKQAVVASLNDLIDAEAGIGAIAVAAAASWIRSRWPACPPKSRGRWSSMRGHRLCACHRSSRRTRARGGPREGHRRHVEGAATVVRLLPKMKALGPSVAATTAADQLAAITDFRFALLLRDSYGWALDHIEVWMTTASQDLLLR